MTYDLTNKFRLDLNNYSKLLEHQFPNICKNILKLDEATNVIDTLNSFQSIVIKNDIQDDTLIVYYYDNLIIYGFLELYKACSDIFNVLNNMYRKINKRREVYRYPLFKKCHANCSNVYHRLKRKKEEGLLRENDICCDIIKSQKFFIECVKMTLIVLKLMESIEDEILI